MGLQLSWGIRVVARSAAGFGAPKPMRRKEAAYASLNRLITRLLLLLDRVPLAPSLALLSCSSCYRGDRSRAIHFCLVVGRQTTSRSAASESGSEG